MAKKNTESSPEQRTRYYEIKISPASEDVAVAMYPERMSKFVMLSLDLIDQGKYLTTNAKWVYVIVRSFKFTDKSRAFPTYETIMKRGNFNRNQVANALSELVHFGWLRRVKARTVKSQRLRNTYEFYYPLTLNKETGEELPDQPCPSKQMADEWKKARREKQKNSKKIKAQVRGKDNAEDSDTG
jgi:hypothetical protein